MTCEQCAFLTDIGCWFSLPVIDGEHDCPQYEPQREHSEDMEADYG